MKELNKFGEFEHLMTKFNIVFKCFTIENTLANMVDNFLTINAFHLA